MVGPTDEGYGLLSSDLGADGSLGSILSIPAGGTAERITQESIDSGRAYVHMEDKKCLKQRYGIWGKLPWQL